MRGVAGRGGPKPVKAARERIACDLQVATCALLLNSESDTGKMASV